MDDVDRPRQPRFFGDDEIPDVEIHVDGAWRSGRLRMWMPVGYDDWEAHVACVYANEQQYVVVCPAIDVRTTDGGPVYPPG